MLCETIAVKQEILTSLFSRFTAANNFPLKVSNNYIMFVFVIYLLNNITNETV
jgi:hypothetical protein